MDRGYDGPDAGVVENRLGNPGGDSFDQVPSLRCHNVMDSLSQQPVIDSLGESVGGSGRRKVHRQLDIDQEVLAVLLLRGQHPVIGEDLDPRDSYEVRQWTRPSPWSWRLASGVWRL